MKKSVLIALLTAWCGAANAQTNTTENPVLIGQQRGFTVSKEQLSKDPILRMPEENKDYHITGYQISYVPKGKGSQLIGPFAIKGDALTSGNAAMIMKKAQPGDRIFLEEIVAVSDAGKQPLKLSAAVKIQ